MTRTTPAALVREIERVTMGQSRVLVGIAGPPGSGKSTLAADLAVRLGSDAAVLPMDGFHLDNQHLREMGRFTHKGAPDTFDAEGFIDLLQRLLRDPVVPYPTFDRPTDETVPAGGQIEAHTRIVLIEGNYLLLNISPWDRLAGLFDLTVCVAVDRAVVQDRLIARWVHHGLPPDAAQARAMGNDMKNVEFVEANSAPSDFTILSGGS